MASRKLGAFIVLLALLSIGICPAHRLLASESGDTLGSGDLGRALSDLGYSSGSGDINDSGKGQNSDASHGSGNDKDVVGQAHGDQLDHGSNKDNGSVSGQDSGSGERSGVGQGSGSDYGSTSDNLDDSFIDHGNNAGNGDLSGFGTCKGNGNGLPNDIVDVNQDHPDRLSPSSSTDNELISDQGSSPGQDGSGLGRGSGADNSIGQGSGSSVQASGSGQGIGSCNSGQGSGAGQSLRFPVFAPNRFLLTAYTPAILAPGSTTSDSVFINFSTLYFLSM